MEIAQAEATSEFAGLSASRSARNLREVDLNETRSIQNKRLHSRVNPHEDSHVGLVFEAYNYFNSMSRDYAIEPEVEHYSCLVDVLGRAGLLIEAEEVIKKMPFEPSVSMLRALLGACRIKGNKEIGQRVATTLLELDPTDSSAYVLLSNLYAATSQWEEVNATRKNMKRRNVKKDPGYSWIEQKHKIHLFVVDDSSHPEAATIHYELEDLMQRIKDEGYVPDTDFAS